MNENSIALENQAVVAIEQDLGEEKIARNTLLVGSMTLISRICGFMRDIIVARIFGASLAFDAFLIAFKIPNFMRRLFAEGAFAQAFVPIIAEYRATRSKDDVKKLLANSYTIMALILLVVVLGGIFTAPLVVKIFAPALALNSTKLMLAAQLLVITLPYIFCISLVALSGGALNSYNRFVVPAATPILLNIGIIFSSFYLIRFFLDRPIYALAWGVFIGGILQLALQIFALIKAGLLVKPSLTSDLLGVKRILKNMIPALFGASVAQLGLMLDTTFGSLLPDGSISWLYYSDRLMQFPLGIFGVGLATVVLPYLSRQHAVENTQKFNDTVNWAFQWALLIGLPSAVGLFCLSDVILYVLFYGQKFTIVDVIGSGASLKAFALGLNFFILAKVLTSIFYSRKDIKTPVKIAAVCLLINIIADIILLSYFKHVAIALGVVISSACNCILLVAVLLKNKIIFFKEGSLSFLIKTLLGNLFLMLFLLISKGDLASWQYNGKLLTMAHVGEMMVISVLLYSIILWLLRVDFIAVLAGKNIK